MKIKMNYPESQIICGTLPEGYVKDNPNWEFPHKWAGISLYEYNAAIKIAARIADVETADLASKNVRYETLDGTHPTKNGYIAIAQAWIACLSESH